MFTNALRSRALALLAGLCLVFAALVAVQVWAIRGADADANAAENDRRVAEDLGQRADLIENVGWRNWASTGAFTLDRATTRDALLLADSSERFYARREVVGSPVERRVAAELVAISSDARRLVAATSAQTSPARSRQIARQVVMLSTQRTNARIEWMRENAVIYEKAEERGRTRVVVLVGLFLLGMLALAAAGLVMRIRATRDRDRAMRELRRTAEEMASLARTDPLTGLSNQREFHAILAREITALRESRSDSLALALIDVDDFKLINDAHGHAVGDHVLIEIGRRLDAHTAPSRLHAARVGGEEFAVIMPRSDRTLSVRLAEQLRSAVATPIAPVGVVTVSVGVALANSDEESHALFRDADAALYAAKRSGKNRVVFADDAIDRSGGANGDRADATFDALRALVSTVDNSQAIDGHSERVARFAARLARQAGWDPSQVARLRQAALLHDVGKVVVPPGILSKPGGLTDGERSLVSVHPAVGSEMARRALDTEQAAWVLHHHERWDGGGYPDGLSGEQIPEGARILAIADAWDAMTSERVFAPALRVTEALAELDACRGSQFWPKGIDLMVEATLSGATEPSAA